MPWMSLPGPSLQTLRARPTSLTAGWARLAMVWAPALALLLACGAAGQSKVNRLGDLSAARAKLPACSALLDWPSAGMAPAPFMAKMGALGIGRAAITVAASIHHGGATDFHVTGEVYFTKIDAGASEVLDPSRLRSISRSGLAAELDRRALLVAQTAPIGFRQDAGPGSLYEGEVVQSLVNFFAAPWLRDPTGPFLFSAPAPSTLLGAVAREDVGGVVRALRNERPGRHELNTAMIHAVLQPFDNAAVITVLAAAGAELEPSPPFVSPLFNALGSPCNVEALLALGADPNARDQSGRTVLRVAGDGGYLRAASLLKAAGARAGRQ